MAASHAKTRIIIDCDPGTDDAQSILMALSHPDVSVVAITTVVGNGTLQNTSRNAVRILKFANRLDIPVFRGNAWSVIGYSAYDEAPLSGYMGVDGFGDVVIEGVDPVDENIIRKEPAAVALSRLVSENPGALTLLATGPLTNIATALSIDSQFGAKLKDCVIMGGNTTGRGNITWSAEANFYNDPEAARCVLARLGKPITLLTLEMCQSYSFTWDWYDKLMSAPTKTAAFLKAVDAFVVKKLRAHGEYLAWDQLAMATVMRPNIVVESQKVYATVELSGALTRGQMVIHWVDAAEAPPIGTKPPNVRLVTKINKNVYTDLIQTTVMHNFCSK